MGREQFFRFVMACQAEFLKRLTQPKRLTIAMGEKGDDGAHVDFLRGMKFFEENRSRFCEISVGAEIFFACHIVPHEKRVK